MTDPQSAIANQLRNIEAKTGKSFAQLCKLVADSGLSKVGEQRSMLMATLGLGYGDANMLALRAKDAVAPAAADANPLDTIYAGNKAPLRALHEALAAAIELGLNIGQLPASVRIKALPPGGMCQFTVRLSTADEIDAELMAWLRAAYQAAG